MVFQGNVFEVTMKHAKWVDKFGAIGYGFLVPLNLYINKLMYLFSKERVSLSKKIKNSVKGAMQFIYVFEDVITSIAAEKGFDDLFLGDIHQPVIRFYQKLGKDGVLNCVDWIENLTALEFRFNERGLYMHGQVHNCKNKL